MNSIACISKVLDRISENMKTFDRNENISSMIDIVCNIGCHTVKNMLPCRLLGNVFKILEHFKTESSLSPATSKFYNEISESYHCETLCRSCKLIILSNYAPAIEFEILALLKECLGIKSPSELNQIKVSLIKSNLTTVCSQKSNLYLKVNSILKRSLVLSEGNPVVGYLTLFFNQSIKDNFNINSFLNDNFLHLELLLSIPQQVGSAEQNIFFINQLIISLIEAVEDKMCDKEDVLFLCVLNPPLYLKILRQCSSSECFYALKFLRVIWNTSCESTLKEKITSVLKNPIWEYLLELC